MLKVSNMIWVIFSRLALGLRGARSGGRAAPRGQHGARCRRCGARSSPCHPVGDDSVLNGVLQGEDTPLGLGLVTDIGILLSHTDHDSLVAGTADNGGEDSSGSVIS